MVEYHLGLTPGVIVGLILVLLVLTAMLVSTIFVVWRSRPAALARAQQKHLEARQKADDLERGAGTTDKSRASSELPVGILKKTRADGVDGEHPDHESQSDASVDGSPNLDSPDLQTPHLGHGSAVNVIIATDGAGGVEVRVTPPTPSQSMAALKGERRVRFETLAGTQGENESVWWFI